MRTPTLGREWGVGAVHAGTPTLDHRTESEAQKVQGRGRRGSETNVASFQHRREYREPRSCVTLACSRESPDGHSRHANIRRTGAENKGFRQQSVIAGERSFSGVLSRYRGLHGEYGPGAFYPPVQAKAWTQRGTVCVAVRRRKDATSASHDFGSPSRGGARTSAAARCARTWRDGEDAAHKQRASQEGPRLIAHATPVLPPGAASRRTEGHVVVSYTVTVEGDVRDAEVARNRPRSPPTAA